MKITDNFAILELIEYTFHYGGRRVFRGIIICNFVNDEKGMVTDYGEKNKIIIGVAAAVVVIAAGTGIFFEQRSIIL